MSETKKKSRKERKKEKKKLLSGLKSEPLSKDEWNELMNFYDSGLSNRWFYADWVAAGKPGK